MGILDFLLGPTTPLLSETEWSAPDLAYASFFDMFYVRYSMKAANKAYAVIAVAFFAAFVGRARLGKTHVYVLALMASLGSAVASLVAAIAVALLMYNVLGRGQSW
jgi:hypothetical protein